MLGFIMNTGLIHADTSAMFIADTGKQSTVSDRLTQLEYDAEFTAMCGEAP